MRQKQTAVPLSGGSGTAVCRFRSKASRKTACGNAKPEWTPLRRAAGPRAPVGSVRTHCGGQKGGSMQRPAQGRALQQGKKIYFRFMEPETTIFMTSLVPS